MHEALCWEGKPVVGGMVSGKGLAQTEKKGCVLYLFF